MFEEILLAIIQAATEFLPISSSGHLALVGNLISKPNLFLITVLHLASLVAILWFCRREIANLLTFKRKTRKLWLYLIIGTIPAALVGYFLKDLIETSLSSFLFLGIAFIFTGFILLLTKNLNGKKKINSKNAFIVGVFQALALFPGVSRSGMTISSSVFLGISREKAVRFSFLLFIPLAIGAMILESGQAYFNLSLVIAFILCALLSLAFLQLVYLVVKRGYFWIFGFYCFILGLISFILHYLV